MNKNHSIASTLLALPFSFLFGSCCPLEDEIGGVYHITEVTHQEKKTGTSQYDVTLSYTFEELGEPGTMKECGFKLQKGLLSSDEYEFITGTLRGNTVTASYKSASYGSHYCFSPYYTIGEKTYIFEGARCMTYYTTWNEPK